MLDFLNKSPAKKECVSFDKLDNDSKKLLHSLAALNMPEEADFYPLLTNMLLTEMSEDDVLAIASELLKISFQKHPNFYEVFVKPNTFCISLMATLLRTDKGPFNFEHRRLLLQHGGARGAGRRLEMLKSSFLQSNNFLVTLLTLLYFEFLRTPSSNVPKPTQQEAPSVFVGQIFKLIKQKLGMILTEAEGFDHMLSSYIKAELDGIYSEGAFKPLAENLASAIELKLDHGVLIDSMQKLKAVHEKWTSFVDKQLRPFHDRVDELSSFIAHMAQLFPASSPRQKSFNSLNAKIRNKYSEVIALLSSDDLECDEETLHRIITSANISITELLQPELNKPIAGQTPLHRLVKEKPAKEHDKQRMKKMIGRLIKEGANLKEETTVYDRGMAAAFKDALSNFPWIGAMVHAFFYNPKRDVYGISASPDVLKEALKQQKEKEAPPPPEGFLSSFKQTVFLRFSSKKPVTPVTPAAATSAQERSKSSCLAPV